MIVDRGAYQIRGVTLSAILGIWILKSLQHVYWLPQLNVGRSVSGLLAGIVLVDVLSIAGGSPLTALIFLGLFGLAVIFQRFIPAT